jgi:hypothetical protein
MASEPILAEPHGEDRDRMSAAELAIGIAWALWAVLMLFAALDAAEREGFFGWF